jgi:hypothetical protein
MATISETDLVGDTTGEVVLAVEDKNEKKVLIKFGFLK